MALTVKYFPPSYASIHDDLIYTVDDNAKVMDPVTYPNFKFIADIYLYNPLTLVSVFVARIKKFPDPVTGLGIFNVSQIARNYLATAFDPIAGILVAQELSYGEFWVNVDMWFGEEWSYSPLYNVAHDTPRTFVNSYNSRGQSGTSVLGGMANSVVSNRPLAGQTFLTSNYLFLPYWPLSGSAVSVIVTPTGGGSGFTTSFTPTAATIMQILNVSPGALNAIHAGAITASTTSYTVKAGAKTYTFRLICEAIYKPYTLHFLNQYGGFDTKVFPKVSRQSFEIEKKDFGKLPFTVDAAGIPSYKTSNGVHNETRSTYSSQFKEKLTLNSDLLTDAEYVWLKDLIVSPMVYLEDAGEFFPVVIAENNYEPKKAVNDDLTNLTINIEFGNRLNAQYR